MRAAARPSAFLELYAGPLPCCASHRARSWATVRPQSSVGPIGVSSAAPAISAPRLLVTCIDGARIRLGKAVPVCPGGPVRSGDRAAVLLAMFTSVCGPGQRASAGGLASLHALSLWLGLGPLLSAVHSAATHSAAACVYALRCIYAVAWRTLIRGCLAAAAALVRTIS